MGPAIIENTNKLKNIKGEDNIYVYTFRKKINFKVIETNIYNLK